MKTTFVMAGWGLTHVGLRVLHVFANQLFLKHADVIHIFEGSQSHGNSFGSLCLDDFFLPLDVLLRGVVSLTAFYPFFDFFLGVLGSENLEGNLRGW